MHIALITDQNSMESVIWDKSLLLFEKSIKELNHTYDIIRWPCMRDNFLKSYKNFDIAIPVIHWWYGEWWQITAMLELLDIPYLFSDHNVHALCLDKYASSILVDSFWYKIPKTYKIQDIIDQKNISFLGPYFIKPNSSWSSLDCWKFDTLDEANELIKKILLYDDVLVQEVIKGREFTVSIAWELNDSKILGIMEVITEKEFFDYDAKYNLDKTREIFPNLPSDFKKQIEEISLEIYKKFHLRDISRIDYLYKDNILYFLEINTIPWMTSTSFLPQCVNNYWYKSFSLFLEELIQKRINKAWI